MAVRAGATITEHEGSHVLFVAQPQVVVDVILQALDTLAQSAAGRIPRPAEVDADRPAVTS